MSQIVLHFDAAADADVDALAAALQQHAAALDGVETAEAEADRTRSIVPDLILYLTLAGTVLGTGATTVDALTKFIHSCKGLATELGLGQPRVEVGMEQVAAADLTPAHAKALQAG
jgi:hypothetical protein